MFLISQIRAFIFKDSKMVFLKFIRVFLICNIPVFSVVVPICSCVSEISKEFLDLAKSPEIFDWMVSIRKKINENPELGYEEFETSKIIRAQLDKMGIKYKYPVAVTGVVGYIGSGEAPFVALRADMDALPMQVCCKCGLLCLVCSVLFFFFLIDKRQGMRIGVTVVEE